MCAIVVGMIELWCLKVVEIPMSAIGFKEWYRVLPRLPVPSAVCFGDRSARELPQVVRSVTGTCLGFAKHIHTIGFKKSQDVK